MKNSWETRKQKFSELAMFYYFLWLLTGWAYRADFFVIGLTNTIPTIQPPTWLNYTMCGQYPGKVPSGAAVGLECMQNPLLYRYLILQSFFTGDALNVCELQVFIRCKYFRFWHPSTKFLHHMQYSNAIAHNLTSQIRNIGNSISFINQNPYITRQRSRVFPTEYTSSP
jgi:hypothetical protein